MTDQPDPTPLPPPKPSAPSFRRGPVTLSPKDLAGRMKRYRVRIVIQDRSEPGR